MAEGEPAILLSDLEARIVGALIEKAVTTPQYYPPSLLALLAACNQKNNRAPVMTLDEQSLARGICGLQDKRLLESFAGATARTLKYRELLTSRLELAPDERAVICELLLRGPQTAGELRGRAARLHPFNSAEEVQETLARLAARPAGALVTELPRQPGQKETRVAHLLCSQPPPAESARAACPPPPAVAVAMEESARLAQLEARVSDLEHSLAALQELFQGFKSQFE